MAESRRSSRFRRQPNRPAAAFSEQEALGKYENAPVAGMLTTFSKKRAGHLNIGEMSIVFGILAVCAIALVAGVGAMHLRTCCRDSRAIWCSFRTPHLGVLG